MRFPSSPRPFPSFPVSQAAEPGCSVALRAKEELGPRIVRLLAPQARLGLSGVTVRTPGGNQLLAQVGAPLDISCLFALFVVLTLAKTRSVGDKRRPWGPAVVAGSSAAAQRQPAALQAVQWSYAQDHVAEGASGHIRHAQGVAHVEAEQRADRCHPQTSAIPCKHMLGQALLQCDEA